MMRMLRRSLLMLLLAAVAWPTSVGAAEPDVTLEPVLDGYTIPVHVTHAPRVKRMLFIAEQDGRIRRAKLRDGAWRKAGTFLDISDRVQAPTAFLEEGLLGMALHPEYRRNGRFYVTYTRQPDGASVVSEFRRLTARRADPLSERVLMVVPQPTNLHNVAHIVFGPDGRLYIGSGDGGAGGDPGENAQDLRSKLGKILRIDPDDPDGAGPRRFSVPRGNPYVGRRGLDSIWASGLRNPWRFAFDREKGHLWVADVGQDQREEVNRSAARKNGRFAGRGVNYGWDDCEGSLEYEDDEGDADDFCDGHTNPVFEYPHQSGRCAAIGGFVHRGPGAMPWNGLYVAADFCGDLFVLDQRGRLRLTKHVGWGTVSFGEDAIGRMFAVNRVAGTLSRVRFRGPRPAILPSSTQADGPRRQRARQVRQAPD